MLTIAVKTLLLVAREAKLSRQRIAYLLKNGCKLPTKPEKPEKFAQRRRKTEIKIERLQEQLNNRIPQGRSLTQDKWLTTLIAAANTVPEDEKVTRSWQDILLTQPKSLPFPVSFETNEDLSWYKNEKGRLCVHFNGLSEHNFQVYCDQRQLKWFQRFFEDQQIKRANKDQHTSALFTLRSALLACLARRRR
jgi:transposase-like protein